MSYLAMPAVLDISSSATINATPNPAVLVLPDINQNANASYDAATGIITILQSDNYTVEFQFLCTSLLGGRFSYYAEVDTGAGFTFVPRSCRTEVVQILTAKLITFGAVRYLRKGDRVRFYTFGTGYTLSAMTPANSPTECPAARIMMSN